MPCPMALTAEVTSIMPSAKIWTCTFSSSALPPVHSKKVAMPKPRHKPLALEAASRLEKPCQSALSKASSMIISKAPVS